MDIHPAEYIPTAEEQEYIDFEEKFERGEVDRYETPIKLYFENHQDLYFDPCALDYVINVAKVKTIGEFIERYEDILPDILNEYPFLNQEDIIERLHDTFEFVVGDAGRLETIRLGPNR